jgi:hypothetical protein
MKVLKQSSKPAHVHRVAKLAELPSGIGKPGSTFSSQDFKSQEIGLHAPVITSQVTTTNVNKTGSSIK